LAGLWLQASLNKKLTGPHINQYLDTVAYACLPSYTEGWDGEDHGSKPSWAKKKKKIVCETPSQQKKAGSGGMYMSSQQLWEV
jgi:hypothetical protein